ncbi:MAG: methyltransferase [Deltaproteobacteria bacterium]|nr:methyltransferase [Deltaproteobacteria bacterium]
MSAVGGRGVEIIEIEDLAAGGAGVGRVRGKVCFVPFTAPGDRASVLVVSESRRMVRAELLEVLEPGAGRRTPKCPLFGRCGGCDLQHVSREEQLSAKSRALSRALGVAQVEVCAAGAELGYRRLARLHTDRAPDGTLVLGFLARASDAIVDLDACPVLHPALEACLAALKAGLLGHVPGRAEVHLAAGADGSVAAIETDGAFSPGFYAAAAGLVPVFAGVVAVTQGVRSVAAGKGDVSLAGADGRPLVTPAPGFGQANEEANLALGRIVSECVAQVRPRSVVELFSGAGNLTVVLAGLAKRVTAAEKDAQACRAARTNLAARRLAGVEVVEGDAFAAYRRHGKGADLVVLDPPREGHCELAAAIAAGGHRAVLYVSCDPATLGRDVEILKAGGFAIVRAAGFDMFPQTAHVEAAVLLAR